MANPGASPAAERVRIVGDGQMALVLADLLAFRGIDVALLSPLAPSPGGIAEGLAATRRSPRLEGFVLHRDVGVGSDPASLSDATVVVAAIPTQFIRTTFGRLGGAIPAGTPIVSVAKGIEVGSFRLPCDVLGEVLGARAGPIAALSGPTIAAELARRLPAALVAASSDEALQARVQALFAAPWTRIYRSGDLIGVELAGACKNVVAIAAGVVDGLGLGFNAKSALLARGLAEIARIGVALGGAVETFYGVAGAGDLATTCFAPEGRNRTFGERLARGEASGEVLGSMTSVVEGVPTSRALVGVARERGIELPICEAVRALVDGETSPREALAALMNRAMGTERIE